MANANPFGGEGEKPVGDLTSNLQEKDILMI